MEPTLEQLNLSKVLPEIYTHLNSEYPREGCGLLAIQKGRLLWVPSRNLAIDGETFILDSTIFMKTRQIADIVGIVHSHPDSSPEPSIHDTQVCNALQIPYYIFSIPDFEMHVEFPKNRTEKPLVGRNYSFGVSDCFELARDYYKSLGIIINPRAAFEDDWWKKGLDYFSKEHLAENKFKPVQEPREGDLLVFSIQASIGNHCGVFLGNDTFIHHAEHRLSCRENLYPFWIQHISGIYRYET